MGRWGRYIAPRRALFAAVAVLLGLLGVARVGQFAAEGSVGDSLSKVLEDELLVDAASVLVWTEAGPQSSQPLLFRGSVARAAPADLYAAHARIGKDGEVLGVGRLSNLTRTSSADETRPVLVGDHWAVYASVVGEHYEALTIVDLTGEAAGLTSEWPARARLQNAITNFQTTGRSRGFGWRRYRLEPASATLEVRVEEGRVVANLDGGRVVLDPREPTPAEGGELLELRPQTKGEPGTITWVVDSVRSLSFVGPEPIAWLENRVFMVKDWCQRVYYDIVGGPDTNAVVAEELGIEEVSVEESRRRAELSITDPELGWPPAAVEPMVRRPGEGEGAWVAVVDDPMLRSYPNAPPAFYYTYLQVDPERPFTRVYIVIWDPRHLQLRIMTGTEEPESATGETGPGMIPRDDETLSRVVAGFNGGFQALHGEFGMMSERRIYLPPKPWAATLSVHQDGQVRMGSWLDPPEGRRFYLESWAVRQIPEDMVEFRQNLTSVVEGDRWNPWRRWYWGAAPADDDEQSYIDRSGVCLTEEGFMAYFWGKSMGAEELGRAMLGTRCVRGMHLDMNQRHTAFEFYNLYRIAAPPPLDRPLRSGIEWDVDIPYNRGWKARGRLLARTMSPMRLPRYIRRDPRDFFYLTLRPTLPGPDIEFQGEAVSFATAGLPHAGWPHAFARARVGEAGPSSDSPGSNADGSDSLSTTGAWVVRIDTTRAVPPMLAREDQRTKVLAYLSNAGSQSAADGDHCLYAVERQVGRALAVGAPPAEAVPVFCGTVFGGSAPSGAALGVDGDGFVVYVEGESDTLRAALDAAGVQNAIALPDDVRLGFVAGDMIAAPDEYEREVVIEAALPLFANERKAAEVLFPEVRPRPYMYWGPMQDTRVRYRRGEGPRRFRSTPEGVIQNPEAGEAAE